MILRPTEVTLPEFILAVRRVRFVSPIVDGASVNPITGQLIARQDKNFSGLPPHIQVALASAEAAMVSQEGDAALAFGYEMKDYRNPPIRTLEYLIRPYSLHKNRWLTLEEVLLLIDRLNLNNVAGDLF